MVVLAVPRFAQLLVAACTVVACSSGPNLRRTLTVNPGERTVVHLIQVNGSLALSLQNESAQAVESVYTPSSGAIDGGRKVVADTNLQTLLDVFSEKGMFEASLAEVPQGSLDALIVEQGKRRWVWAVSANKHARIAALQRGDHSEQTFHDARAEFLALYNSSMAFHGTGEERPDFKAESGRIKSDNSDSQRRNHR